MSQVDAHRDSPSGVRYVVAGVVGVLVAAVVYLVGLVISIAITFRALHDPLSDPVGGAVTAFVVLLSVSFFVAGLVGAWLAGRMVVRRGAGPQGVWSLVGGMALLGVVLLVIGVTESPWSTVAQAVGLLLGLAGGAGLALRARRT